MPKKPKANKGELSAALVEDVLRDAPALMTFKQTAEHTGISKRTWHRWVAQGLVRVVRPAGGQPRIPRLEVARVLQDGLL